MLLTHWVQQPGVEYPRYGEATKPGFLAIWRSFSDFLEKNHLPKQNLVQWEVTYINRVPAGELWKTPGDWPTLFNGLLVSPPIPDGSIESALAVYHYRLTDNAGRLHVEIRHATEPQEGVQSLDITLTARGPLASPNEAASAVDSPTIEQRIAAGLDIGRRAIVRGFESIVSQKARDYWGYKKEIVDA